MSFTCGRASVTRLQRHAAVCRRLRTGPRLLVLAALTITLIAMILETPEWIVGNAECDHQIPIARLSAQKKEAVSNASQVSFRQAIFASDRGRTITSQGEWVRST